MMTGILLILPCVFLTIIQKTLSDVYVYNDFNTLIEDYDDQPASFGPAFTANGITGYLSLTNPRNACTKIAPAPNIPIFKYHWIALIPRTKTEDTCDFDLKVLNAQNANFSGVIIYNYEDILVTMGSHGRNIHIPSTLITHSDGLSIIANYLYNETLANSSRQFHVKITTEQLFRFGAYLIPFICVVSVSFLSLIIFMLVKCYIQRRRLRRHRLPRSALKQLKTKKFVKGDRWEVCAICLDDFEDGAKLRILPCDHAYHMKCIDPWLLNNRRQCPICKRYVFPNHDNSDEETNEHTATERTPLLQSSNENSISTASIPHETERRMLHSSSAGFSNITSNVVIESTDTDDDDDDNGSPSSGQTARPNRITTNELIFDRSHSDSLDQLNPNQPRLVICESSSEHIGQNSSRNTTTTTAAYESAQDSFSTSFTTPRAANFFVGSPGGTTDNTNISVHSVIEDGSDIEVDDTDERMHSVLTDVGVNHAYASDETKNEL